MTDGQDNAGDTGSAGDGAAGGAGGARGGRRWGAGSPPGMYGGLIGGGDVQDILDELRQLHPDARLHLDVIGPDGIKRAGQTYSVTSFDFDTIAGAYAGCECRVRAQLSGQPKPVKMFRFVVATRAVAQRDYTPPAPQQLPPPPSYYPPAPYAQPHPQQLAGYAPPPPPQPQQQAPGIAEMFGVMMQLATKNAEQQQALTNTLLTKLIDQRTQAPEPRNVTELEALLRLTDKLSRRRGGDDQDDDAGAVGGSLLKDVVAGLFQGMRSAPAPAAPQPQPNQTPAARRTPPKVRPAGVPTHFGGATPPRVAPAAASPEAVTPSYIGADHAGDVEAHQAGQAAGAAPSPTPPPPATPADPFTAMVVNNLRGNADARRLAKLLLVDDGEDPGAIAAMALTLMDDAAVETVRASEAGKWGELFRLAWPELERRRELVDAVEAELRRQIEDEDGAGGAVDGGEDDGGDDDGEEADAGGQPARGVTVRG